MHADEGRQPSWPAPPTLGFVLAHEQFPVPELVEYGIAAEQAGFDAVWASDHFHPWQDNQGHAGFAWATLAALGQRTARIALGTGVTCPTYRYNPAIVAAGFASLSLLYPGRVSLGVGTGEAMNEVRLLCAGGAAPPAQSPVAGSQKGYDLESAPLSSFMPQVTEVSHREPNFFTHPTCRGSRVIKGRSPTLVQPHGHTATPKPTYEN